MRSYLDFEKPVAELEAKVEELRAMQAGDDAADIADEIARLETKAAQALRDLYAELTPWQKTQVARHPQRPHCLDYISALITGIHRRSPATASSARTRRSSAASAASAARASASSATRRARRPRAGSSTISAWRGRRATARRCG